MILYLDTETTSLRPGQICQLSYVMQDKNGIRAKNFFFECDSVDYGAYLVHGFSVEKLKKLSNGWRFIDHAFEIEQDLACASVVVAHNSSFDLMFLRAEFERIGKVLPISQDFCSMKSMTPVCKLAGRREGYKYPKLVEMCQFFGITDTEIKEQVKLLFGDCNGFHDARFDTTAVFLAMEHAMERHIEKGFLRDKL